MIRLDGDRCIGCGRCVEVCPAGFEMRGEKAALKDPNAACVGEAMAACPVGAIVADGQAGFSGAVRSAFPAEEPFAPFGFIPPVQGQGMGVGRGMGRGLGRGPRDGRGMGRGGGGRRGF
jgi:ferredoxin